MDTIISFQYQHHNDESAEYTFRITKQSFPEHQVLHVFIGEQARNETDLRIHNALKALPPTRFLLNRIQQRRQRSLADSLAEQIAPELDKWGENACVFPEKMPADHWLRTLLPLPEFDAFEEIKWIRRLYPYAVNHDFIVLGSIGCLPTILEELSPRMKSLMWVVPDFTYKDQAEELVENFYRENGLAVNLRFLGEGTTYAGLRIPQKSFPGPVNVLDLTGGKYLPDFTPAPGSVWIDIYAREEKERRIRARGLKARYCSLLDTHR